MSALHSGRAFLAGLMALFIIGAIPGGAALAQTVESGSFSRQDYSIAGNWKIVKQGGSYYVELSSNFKTQPGPDLKLFLSRKAPKSLTGSGVTKNGLRVSPIRASGKQKYKLPAGVNPKDFKSVVIHCEKFSKLWGAGGI